LVRDVPLKEFRLVQSPKSIGKFHEASPDKAGQVSTREVVRGSEKGKAVDLERPTTKGKTLKESDVPSRGPPTKRDLDEEKSNEDEEALGLSRVGDMRQWTDEMSQAQSSEEQTIYQEIGASGGDILRAGLSPVCSPMSAEVETAFGPLSGEIALSVNSILDPVFMINFDNVSELDRSIHRLVGPILSICQSHLQYHLSLVILVVHILNILMSFMYERKRHLKGVRCKGGW